MIWIGVFIILSAISEAIMDKLQHSFNESVFRDLNENWWDPTFSWRNKYKCSSPYMGPKFFLSTTALVFLTDAWHLFKALRTFFLWTAVAFIVYSAREFSIHGIIALIGTVALLKSAIFELFYSKILKQ